METAWDQVTPRRQIVVSNLPGELTIYQLGFPYETTGLLYTPPAPLQMALTNK